MGNYQSLWVFGGDEHPCGAEECSVGSNTLCFSVSTVGCKQIALKHAECSLQPNRIVLVLREQSGFGREGASFNPFRPQHGCMGQLYCRRVEEARGKMGDIDAGLMVVSPGPNMFYLSGVRAEPSERHFFLLVPSESDPVFVAPELARSEVEESGFDARFWKDSENPETVLSGVLDELGVARGRVLIDDRMWACFSSDIRGLTHGDYGLASEVLRPMRMVKDDEELECIREASAIADRVMADVRNMDAVGMTEKELQQLIEAKMDEYGGEGPGFETIVAAGPNGSQPHHRGDDREIRAGEPVVLDFGCWKSGYPSDMTRTLVFGQEPSRKFKEVFETVESAQQKAVDAVEPGIRSDKIDRVSRGVIEDAGYGDKFTHRTGHGVGLEIHEHPKIPEIGEQVELRSNMVFSVEPGVYIEGEFGVRIEDLVVVTEDGCERLNMADRCWRV